MSPVRLPGTGATGCCPLTLWGEHWGLGQQGLRTKMADEKRPTLPRMSNTTTMTSVGGEEATSKGESLELRVGWREGSRARHWIYCFHSGVHVHRSETLNLTSPPWPSTQDTRRASSPTCLPYRLCWKSPSPPASHTHPGRAAPRPASRGRCWCWALGQPRPGWMSGCARTLRPAGVAGGQECPRTGRLG